MEKESRGEGEENSTGEMFDPRTSYFLLLLLTWLLSVAKAGRYEYIVENDAVFDKCPELENNNGIDDLMDMSGVNFEYFEGKIYVTGNASLVWEGVESTDIVTGYGELLKFQRGYWQPTPIYMSTKDFCSIQFNKASVWYQMWTRYIPEDERKCINNYGHIYHYENFNVNTVLEFAYNMEGRYKLLARFQAVDPETKEQRPKEICFQIFGEFVKVK
ncbi:uncharacterized protein LOC133325949 [Musca vetustissima]|uniref:uncharacterized protein LOC133325949 n=1 Tax=Musca vetustissima TaxID=27455 RepID=UPI002AB78809|nr:uncharacterized protein LOC133325949 [Musca vetustissima]